MATLNIDGKPCDTVRFGVNDNGKWFAVQLSLSNVGVAHMIMNLEQAERMREELDLMIAQGRAMATAKVQ